MKKFFKSVLTMGLVGLAGISLSSCDSEEYYTRDLQYGAVFDSVDVSNVKFVKDNVLTVGMSTDFAPMEFVDSTQKGQNQFVGCDVSFAQALAKAFGVELKIKAMSFDSILATLDNNQIDVAISGFSYTDERAASYLPTECYYSEGDGGQVYLIKAEDKTKFTTLESINNKNVKVGVQSGSLQEQLTTAQVPNCNMITFTNIDDAITALEAGTYDAICCAKTVADNKVVLNSNLAIMDEALSVDDDGNYAWVEKNNKALKTAIDSVISQVKSNNYFSMWFEAASALQLSLGDKASEIIPE